MSVTRVTRTNLTGEHTAEDHSYSHTYEVEVSSREDQQNVVLTGAGLPNLGDRHPNDMSAVVTSKRARLRDERRWKLWTVDINYAILAGQDDVVTRDPTQAPDLRAPELRLRPISFDRVLREDLDGNPFINTAGEVLPNEECIVRSFAAQISYRRWYRAVAIDPYYVVTTWSGKFNASQWFTIPAETAQIEGVSLEREWWNNELFFRADFEITAPSYFSPYHLAANVGMNVRKGFIVNGVDDLKPILVDDIDNNGNPTGLKHRVSTPVPLSQNGKEQLPAGARPIMLRFRVYETIDFGSIGL